MTSLTGLLPYSTYKQLLQIGSSNVGLTASIQYIQDGSGTNSVLGLSTTNVEVNAASITINGFVVSVTDTSFLSGTNTGDQTITLTGDVTGSGAGSFAATIASNAVTYAKMQQISTGKLLGSNNAGTANIAEVTVGSGLSLSNGTLSATAQAGGLVGIQIFSSGSGTYTPTSGMGHIIVEMVGGGGGGGGVSNANAYAIANGGNAGTYMKFMMTAAQVGASKTYTVGAAANGGSAGNNAGTNGNNTVFADWTAAGGKAGAGMAGTTAPQVSAAPTANGASTSGTGTLILSVSGALSTCGFAISTPLGKQSFGGKSYLSGRNNDATNVRDDTYFITTGSVAGQNGSPNLGNGGHGAISVNNSANLGGGNGTAGYIIVYEFA